MKYIKIFAIYVCVFFLGGGKIWLKDLLCAKVDIFQLFLHPPFFNIFQLFSTFFNSSSIHHPGHCGGFTSNLLIYNTALRRQQYFDKNIPNLEYHFVSEYTLASIIQRPLLRYLLFIKCRILRQRISFI